MAHEKPIPFATRVRHQPPGLNGTYKDSCVVCLQGCDTHLGFHGVAEWCIAGLQVLGIPDTEATDIVSHGTGRAPGMVPGGIITTVFRVCEACVTRSGMALHVRPVGTETPLFVRRARD